MAPLSLSQQAAVIWSMTHIFTLKLQGCLLPQYLASAERVVIRHV